MKEFEVRGVLEGAQPREGGGWTLFVRSFLSDITDDGVLVSTAFVQANIGEPVAFRVRRTSQMSVQLLSIV